MRRYPVQTLLWFVKPVKSAMEASHGEPKSRFVSSTTASKCVNSSGTEMGVIVKRKNSPNTPASAGKSLSGRNSRPISSANVPNTTALRERTMPVS